MSAHAADLHSVPSWITVLPVPDEFPRFCPACERVATFTVDRECRSGRIGRCECGEEFVIAFTRTTEEAC